MKTQWNKKDHTEIAKVTITTIYGWANGKCLEEALSNYETYVAVPKKANKWEGLVITMTNDKDLEVSRMGTTTEKEDTKIFDIESKEITTWEVA